MPTIPLSGVNQTDTSRSTLESPTPENLLMAAATMHQMGKFDNPVPKLKRSDSTSTRPRHR